MIEVVYYNEILQELEKIQKSILSRENIIKTCYEKWGSFSISPFKYEVIGTIVHKIDIANGYLYEQLLTIFLKSIKDGKNSRYEILEECQQQYIKQYGFDVITKEDMELDRDIDLLFKDLKTNVIYCFEIRRKCNQDSYRKKMTVRKFYDTDEFIKARYSESTIVSKIMFVEEDRELSYGNIDREVLTTGKTFFKEFLNSDIETFFQIFEECKNKLKIKNSHQYMEELIIKFEIEAEKYGPLIAKDKLNGITYSKNVFSSF